MAKYQILHWRKIPIQVKAFDAENEAKEQLPERFQVAIDELAMAQGAVGTDAYLEAWEWTPVEEQEGTPEEVSRAVAEELIKNTDLSSYGGGLSIGIS